MNMYNNEIKAFTNYPLLGIDDQVYAVSLICYDRNKYVKVILSGITYEIKLGYIFKDIGCTVNFRNNNKLYALPKFDGGMRNTKLQVVQDLKKERKRKTQYYLYTEANTFKFKTLDSAISKISTYNSNVDFYLYKGTRELYSGNSQFILERTSGNLCVIGYNKNRSLIKSRHCKNMLNVH